jgi:hypothetical protein
MVTSKKQRGFSGSTGGSALRAMSSGAVAL